MARLWTDAWTGLCVREADVVIAVTGGAPDASCLQRATALRGCELLAFGPGVAAGVVDALQPREFQVISDATRRTGAIEATARRLAGHSLGIVLSGGGARALAHLGVLEDSRRRSAF